MNSREPIDLVKHSFLKCILHIYKTHETPQRTQNILLNYDDNMMIGKRLLYLKNDFKQPNKHKA